MTDPTLTAAVARAMRAQGKWDPEQLALPTPLTREQIDEAIGRMTDEERSLMSSLPMRERRLMLDAFVLLDVSLVPEEEPAGDAGSADGGDGVAAPESSSCPVCSGSRTVGGSPCPFCANTIGKFQREGQSSTSKQAAIEASTVTGAARSAVYQYVQECGHQGATDEEVQRGLGMNPSTQRPRRVELVEAGAIVDSGVKRPTASGRDAVVWVASAAA